MKPSSDRVCIGLYYLCIVANVDNLKIYKLKFLNSIMQGIYVCYVCIFLFKHNMNSFLYVCVSNIQAADLSIYIID